MFIRGLNRFFAKHGRKIFAVFTGMIIISFVLYFTPGFDISHLFSGRTAPQELAGKISKEEFNEAFNSSLILISLQLGGAPLNEQFVQQMAYYRTLEWAVSAKIAEQKGFTADDEDVVEMIKKQQIFRGKNGFDRRAYDLYVQNVLSPYRFSSLDLENALRKDIAQNRLRHAITNSVVVSDKEFEDEYKWINTRINAVLFSFKSEDFIPESVDEEKVRGYFNANKEKYQIPPQSKTHVTRFNYIDFKAEAEKSVTEAEIEEYYNSNKNKFTKEDKVEPLDAVKDQIKKTLIKEKSVEAAYKNAQRFSLDVFQEYVDQQSKTLKTVFEENAKDMNLTLVQTDWFDNESKFIKNIGAEPEFSKAASELFLDQPLSEAIKGQRAAFVALLTERQDAKQAEFEDVKEKVISEFKKLEAAKIANQKASEAALSIVEKLGEGAAADTIDEFKSGFAGKIPEFSFGMPPPAQFSNEINSLAMKTPEGRLSELKNIGADTIFIFVESKKTPVEINPEEFEKFKRRYKINKQNLAWNNFLTSSLNELKK